MALFNKRIILWVLLITAGSCSSCYTTECDHRHKNSGFTMMLRQLYRAQLKKTNNCPLVTRNLVAYQNIKKKVIRTVMSSTGLAVCEHYLQPRSALQLNTLSV